MDRKKLEIKGSVFEGYVASILTAKFPNMSFILNKELYSPFLKKDTQIDIIAISNKCVYVIEAKNWSTYVKGSYDSDVWHGKGDGQQMTIFSPVNQNLIHIRSLLLALINNYGFNKIRKIPIHSIVVFPTSCQLLTECTEVCSIASIERIIKEYEERAGYIELNEVYEMIKTCK